MRGAAGSAQSRKWWFKNQRGKIQQVSQKSSTFHKPGNSTHSGFHKITMIIMLGLCLYIQLHNLERDCGGNVDMFFDVWCGETDVRSPYID